MVPAIRALHRVLHRRVWDGGPVRISGTVRAGDEIAGFEVVDLAGHAPGRSACGARPTASHSSATAST